MRLVHFAKQVSIASLLFWQGCMLSLQIYEEPKDGVVQDSSTDLVTGDLFVTASATLTAGQCSAVLLELKDTGGDLVQALSATTFNLTSAGSVAFYDSGGCGSAITTLAWPQGQSLTNVWVRTTAAGSDSFTISDAGSGYTTRNHSVTVSAAAAAQLAFLSQPSNSQAGAVVNATLRVEVQDTYGNKISGSTATIAMSIQSNPGASTLSGTASVSAVAGVATFTNLSLNKVGDDYVLRASSAGLGTVDSDPFDISPGAATRLRFTTEPSANGTVGVALAQQPIVSVVDAHNNVVPSASATITLEPYNNTSTCSSPGYVTTLVVDTNPVATTNGVSAFTGLKYNWIGNLYLRASATGLTAACSARIALVAGPAITYQFSAETYVGGSSVAVRTVCSQDLVFKPRDQFGNVAGVPSARTVNLLGNGAGTFYSDATCTTPITSVSFSNGSSNGGGVYFKSSTLESLTLTSQDTHGTPLASGALAFDVANVSSASLSQTGACAIVAGRAMCWGSGAYGKLGNYFNPSNGGRPSQVWGMSSGSSAISSGRDTNCGIKSGRVWCWGGGGNGILGNGATADSSQPVEVATLPNGATHIAVGTSHACAIVSGAAYCWGAGTGGQLGNGANSNSSVPVAVTGLSSGVSDIDAGNGFTCAVVSGAAYCWGDDTNGRLGNGASSDSNVPSPVSGLTAGVTQVATGSAHACAVVSGAVKCWGNGGSGRLGNGATSNQSAPVDVTGLTADVTQVEVDSHKSCALQNGAVKCWGRGFYGSLGDGDTSDELTPVQVTGLTSGVTALFDLESSYDMRTCAIVDGVPQCWGYYGQNPVLLGAQSYGDATFPVTSPVEIDGMGSGVTSLGNTRGHRCAVQSGEAYCWGENVFNQLGTLDGQPRWTPVKMPGLSTSVTQVGSGIYHTCFLDNGGVKCIGLGGDGQLGNNATSNATSVVSVVGLGSGVTQIAIGTYFGCAIQGGAVKCWGLGTSGQLGNGLGASSSVPVNVTGMDSGVTFIAAGPSNACAVKNSNAYCWGANSVEGVLGDGSTTQKNAPVQVAGLSGNVTRVAIESVTACAVDGGAAKCWGNGLGGGLGNGGTANSLTPVQVSGLTSSVSEIAVGFGNSNVAACALQGDAMWCWGDNAVGSLGDGSTTTRTLPVNPVGLGSGVIAIHSNFSSRIFGAIKTGGAAYAWGPSFTTLGDLGATAIYYAPTPQPNF